MNENNTEIYYFGEKYGLPEDLVKNFENHGIATAEELGKVFATDLEFLQKILHGRKMEKYLKEILTKALCEAEKLYHQQEIRKMKGFDTRECISGKSVDSGDFYDAKGESVDDKSASLSTPLESLPIPTRAYSSEVYMETIHSQNARKHSKEKIGDQSTVVHKSIEDLRKQLEHENEIIETLVLLSSNIKDQSTPSAADILCQSKIDHQDRARKLKKMIHAKQNTIEEKERISPVSDKNFMANFKLSNRSRSTSTAADLPPLQERVVKQVFDNTIFNFDISSVIISPHGSTKQQEQQEGSQQPQQQQHQRHHHPAECHVCKKCRRLTEKRFFCQLCIKEFEKKNGYPFTGECSRCQDCAEITMNEQYCDDCTFLRNVDRIHQSAPI